MSPSNNAKSGPMDLEKLSDDELHVLMVEVPKEYEKRKTKREAELLAFIREQIATNGISTARLRAALWGKAAARARATTATDGRSRVKPKFWNPKDHAQRWSGRGARPQWFTEHLAAGGTDEAMRIPEGAV